MRHEQEADANSKANHRRKLWEVTSWRCVGRRVWSLLDGKCVHVLAGHTGRINAVSVSEDNRLAATASDDGTARIWSLDDGSCAQVLAFRAARSPAGHLSKDTACGWSHVTLETVFMAAGAHNSSDPYSSVHIAPGQR